MQQPQIFNNSNMAYQRYESIQEVYEELGIFVPNFIKENVKHELKRGINLT